MDNVENRESYEISFKDLFQIFKQGLWLMVVAAILLGAVSFVYSKFFIAKTYTASVKLYVETTGKGESGYNDLSSYNLATSLVNDYIEMLETNKFFDKLSRNLDDKYTAGQLNAMVDFKGSDKETQVFSAIVAAHSPTEAKIIADAVADVAPGIIGAIKDHNELKIVDNAIIPTYPSAPSVTRNTLFAMGAGFFFFFIYVFAREALDNKIKYNPDMTEINSIPILSAIPDFSGQKIIIDDVDASESEAENGKEN